jgi:hypothetical protein
LGTAARRAAFFDASRAAYNCLMAAARFTDPIEPMTLGNMRANGVRSLDVSCWQCHHRAIMSADPWSDDVPVPTFGPRMVCTRCAIIGADARPYRQEQPPRACRAQAGRPGDVQPANRLKNRGIIIGQLSASPMRTAQCFNGFLPA